ncbi:M4 family metallopeptidase [Bacillus thuringiensis]|uniref:M4 family metallopeptidase n=1 Tax=Bacillus thuringiensis TaxID=1428 RepID=UPI000CD93C39|nr:M4 family metallopeptidase [Bacillus thuringiensis]
MNFLFVFGLIGFLFCGKVYAEGDFYDEVQTEVVRSGLTIGKLTLPQNSTKEKVVKSYLKREIVDSKIQEEQTTSEKDVDFYVLNQEVKGIQTEIRLKQMYKNYKVYGQDIIVNIDDKGIIHSVSGKVAQKLDTNFNLNTSDLLTSDKVKSALKLDLNVIDGAVEKEYKTERVVYPKKDGNYTLAEVVTFVYEQNEEVMSGSAIVNLIDGKILFKEKILKDKKKDKKKQIFDSSFMSIGNKGKGINAVNERFIFDISKGTDGFFYLIDLTRGKGIYIYDAHYADAEGGTSEDGYPGTFITSNSTYFNDKEAVGVMKNMSTVYDYFKTQHDLKSYDNQDTKIVASVHGFDSEEVAEDEGKNTYKNAFWHPRWKQIVFGDGLDGKLTSAIDLTAHEYGHAIFNGITKNNVINHPNSETSALDEGLADFWGTQVEFYMKKGKGNWIIGDTLDDLLMRRDIPNEIGDGGERLYTNLQDFYKNDNFQDSHLNSGIISHVLYQLSEGTQYNSISVSKLGNYKVSKIVMHALKNYITSSEDFKSLQAHIVQSANDLYGIEIANEVEKAFVAHGYPSEKESLYDVKTVE